MPIKIRPYRWSDHVTEERVPGIRIENEKVYIWLPMGDAHKIADQIVDIAERFQDNGEK